MMTESDATVLACQLKNVRMPEGAISAEISTVSEPYIRVHICSEDYVNAFGPTPRREFTATYDALETMHAGVTFIALVAKEQP